MGEITAEAPASSTREAVANSPTGIRTRAGLPAAATSGIARRVAAKSIAPCCMSMVMASNSSRASRPATDGSGRPHQADRTGVPDRSLLVRMLMVDMGFSVQTKPGDIRHCGQVG
jgi:hypothetical protein